MKFDISLTNGRIDTIEFEGVNDIVDLLGLLQSRPDDWLSGKIQVEGARQQVFEFRVLVKVSEIVSVSERK